MNMLGRTFHCVVQENAFDGQVMRLRELAVSVAWQPADAVADPGCRMSYRSAPRCVGSLNLANPINGRQIKIFPVSIIRMTCDPQTMGACVCAGRLHTYVEPPHCPSSDEFSTSRDAAPLDSFAVQETWPDSWDLAHSLPCLARLRESRARH